MILRNKIIKLALLQIKKEYVHGSHGPDNFDCAGFVWYVYYSILDIDIYKEGFGISTTTKMMTSIYGELSKYEEISGKNMNELNIGDILFFHRQSKEDNEPLVDNKYPGHCGIYLGNSEFIHCSGTKKRVLINNLSTSKYWNRVLVGKKDIISTIK